MTPQRGVGEAFVPTKEKLASLKRDANLIVRA